MVRPKVFDDSYIQTLRKSGGGDLVFRLSDASGISPQTIYKIAKLLQKYQDAKN